MTVDKKELRDKLEWVRACKCESCGKHDQTKTGCPSCDFAHSDYSLFTNKEVLALLDQHIKAARVDELEKMLMAEYRKGTFAQPTTAPNEFLEKTPLIASYVLRNRIKELRQLYREKS